MKLITIFATVLFVSSAIAAPQFEAISSILSTASQAVGNGAVNTVQAIGSLLPSSSNTVEKSNPLGCSVYFSGQTEGTITAQAVGGTYSLCFEPEESTCGIQFDFTQLMSVSSPVNQENTLVSQPAALTNELCENYLIFPPTSSSPGSKAVCLDNVVEPSMLLIGTPMVVYAHSRPGKEFSIPYSYLTSC